MMLLLEQNIWVQRIFVLWCGT